MPFAKNSSHGMEGTIGTAQLLPWPDSDQLQNWPPEISGTSRNEEQKTKGDATDATDATIHFGYVITSIFQRQAEF